MTPINISAMSRIAVSLSSKGFHRSMSSTCQLGAVAVVSSLYPHPSASAAGVRTHFMLDRFTKHSSIDHVHYLTGAAPNDLIENSYPNVSFHHIPPNDSAKMESLLGGIGSNLSMVIFDRFYAEEAYSFHFKEHCPHAIRIVDMQDMHSLRLGRQRIIFRNRALDSLVEDPFQNLNESIQHKPTTQDEILLRELASLHRSDLVMVCSPYEMALLKKFGIPSSKLIKAPFWIEPTEVTQPGTRTTFASRNNFVFLGGFKHPPNVDTVKVLAEVIWPRIHSLLPEASLNIYGAFCPQQLMTKYKSVPNFFIHGFAPSLEDILTQHRVMLAPLRFGAGIKGKIVDAWRFGLPVVSTEIGAEGMTVSDIWGGKITHSVDDHVTAATELYQNELEWADASRQGTELLDKLFPVSQWDSVMAKLIGVVQHRDELRSSDYQGAILWHQTTRSTEFFSRWIECKNKGNIIRDNGAITSKSTNYISPYVD